MSQAFNDIASIVDRQTMQIFRVMVNVAGLSILLLICAFGANGAVVQRPSADTQPLAAICKPSGSSVTNLYVPFQNQKKWFRHRNLCVETPNYKKSQCLTHPQHNPEHMAARTATSELRGRHRVPECQRPKQIRRLAQYRHQHRSHSRLCLGPCLPGSSFPHIEQHRVEA